jgi:predicted transcriptional regulator
MNNYTIDEAILALLRRSARTSLELADALDMSQRSVRRRLRRLIKDGYAFSPARGTYRICAAGLRAMEDLPDVWGQEP